MWLGALLVTGGEGDNSCGVFSRIHLAGFTFLAEGDPNSWHGGGPEFQAVHSLRVLSGYKGSSIKRGGWMQ